MKSKESLKEIKELEKLVAQAMKMLGRWNKAKRAFDLQADLLRRARELLCLIPLSKSEKTASYYNKKVKQWLHDYETRHARRR